MAKLLYNMVLARLLSFFYLIKVRNEVFVILLYSRACPSAIFFKQGIPVLRQLYRLGDEMARPVSPCADISDHIRPGSAGNTNFYFFLFEK
jgi:hypothetical protein